jgi:hypothetical protein
MTNKTLMAPQIAVASISAATEGNMWKKAAIFE